MKLAVSLALATAATVAAQNEVLYYKFEGGGTKAINYAANSPAPAEAAILNTLTTAPVESYVAGQFGEALNSGLPGTPIQANYIATGWAPSVTGDYTWAAWFRNTRGTPAPSLTYLAGIPVGGQFRLFTGGGALFTTGNAGGTTSYATLANIYQMATAGWVHVAWVVDTVAMTGTYYINGVAEPPRTLTGMPNISGPVFNVGRQLLTAAPSIYDIDEFRFLTRAATATEVQAWATLNSAASASFGQGCGGQLFANAAGGLPVLGSATFGMDITSSAPNSFGVVALGFSRTTWGALPLPLDLGLVFSQLSGCPLEASLDATATVVTDGSGGAQLPFPLPAAPIYDGVSIYAQALLFGGPNGLSTTNPFTFVVGN